MHSTPWRDLCHCNKVGFGTKRLIFRWLEGVNECNSKSAAWSVSERDQRSLAGHGSLWTPVTVEISAIFAKLRFSIELLLYISYNCSNNVTVHSVAPESPSSLPSQSSLLYRYCNLYAWV